MSEYLPGNVNRGETLSPSATQRRGASMELVFDRISQPADKRLAEIRREVVRDFRLAGVACRRLLVLYESSDID